MTPRLCSRHFKRILILTVVLIGIWCLTTYWIFNQEPDFVIMEEVTEKLIETPKEISVGGFRKGKVNYDVHIFYYAWYGNPKSDGEWIHWNHEYIPQWDQKDTKVYPAGKHDPDQDDIGANFFPEIGAYSSKDPEVLAKHMKQIRESGAGVLSISWYPPNTADENGKPVDALLPEILDAADKEGLKVALHVEPYTGRNAETFRENLSYVLATHAKHPAFYKRKRGNKLLPVYYIYDSYRTPSTDWARIFSKSGDISVRDTELDGIFLGLFVESRHRTDILEGKFDGFYTYFAANGFTYGSTLKNWSILSKFARTNSLLFVPSVGPGYIDTRVRPWNDVNTRHRRRGEYYNLSWKHALSSGSKMISVTSFNEWHEGTQIEPCVPKSIKGYTYQSYEPENPGFYLKMTQEFSIEFDEARRPKKS